MRRRTIISFALQGIFLIASLVPIFPGVFLRGERLVPTGYLYDYAPWSQIRPSDLPKQNPLGLEVMISVCAWYRLTNDALDRGDWPLWNPYQFFGAPLLGNYQTAVFYPPRLIIRLFDDLWLGMTFYILLRLWLCGMCAFVAGRILGLKTAFASFFSLAYMLAGYTLMWTYYPPPDPMAWLPLLFAGTELTLTKRYRSGFALATLATTLMLLAGHPSTVLMSGLGTMFYAKARLATMRGNFSHARRCVALAAGAMVLAVGICAAQLLPFLEYMRHAAFYIERFDSGGTAQYRFSFFDLLTAWSPRLLGTEMEGTFWGTTNHTYLGMLYCGAPIGACLLLLLAKLRFTIDQRKRNYALLGVTAFCVYCATDFPYADLVQALPLLSTSRPAYFMAFPTLALTFAGSVAVQAWMTSKHPARTLARPLGAAIVITTIVIAMLAFASYTSPQFSEIRESNTQLLPYIYRQVATTLGFIVAAFALFALHQKVSARTLAFSLCAILLADHAVATKGFFGTTPGNYIFPETKLTEFLRAQPKPCRVRFDSSTIPSGLAPQYGIEESFGYDAVYPARIKPYLDQLNSVPGTTADALFSCDFALFNIEAPLPEAYSSVGEFDRVRIAKRKSQIPRARLVSALETFDSPDAMFAKMMRADFDPLSVVYTDVDIHVKLPASPSPPGDAVITTWQAQHVSVIANALSDCILVLADGYYPGWHATVDGAPVDIFPAYHLFRGVKIPAGKHTVEFTYRPASVRIGLAISVTALIVSALLALRLIAVKRT